ncbi:MAG: hypothetical protein CL397_07505, partial [Acidiferrobacteraceae bacterium]|nr:hypothetical protein [Acidiferrobacteraceae bacterium]
MEPGNFWWGTEFAVRHRFFDLRVGLCINCTRRLQQQHFLRDYRGQWHNCGAARWLLDRLLVQ